MGKSFLKLGLLALITICTIACDPDDLVTTSPTTEIQSFCCGENGQLPSEPGEEEEDDEDSFVLETPTEQTTKALCCGENGQLPSEPGEEEEEDE